MNLTLLSWLRAMRAPQSDGAVESGAGRPCRDMKSTYSSRVTAEDHPTMFASSQNARRDRVAMR